MVFLFLMIFLFIIQIFGMVVIFVILLFVFFLFALMAWVSAGFEQIMRWNEWAHMVILSGTSLSSALHLALEALSESKESTEKLVDGAWGDVWHERMHVDVLNVWSVVVAFAPAVLVVLLMVEFLFLLLKLLLFLFELMLLLFQMANFLLKAADLILHLVLLVGLVLDLFAERINLVLKSSELQSQGENYADEDQNDKTRGFSNEIQCLFYGRLVSFLE